MGNATSKKMSTDTFTELFSRLDIEFARVDQCRLRSAAASYDLQQCQTDIETREHDLYKKQVAAEEHAFSLSQRKYALASKEAAAKELETVLGWRQATLNARESGLYGREKSLDESEAAVAMRQDALDRREAAAKERESGIVWRESSLNAREASLWTREQALGDKEEMKAKLHDLQEKLNTAEQWCEDLVSCNAEFEKTIRDLQGDEQLHDNRRTSDVDTPSTTEPQQDGLNVIVADPHDKSHVSKAPTIPPSNMDEVDRTNDGADGLQARMERLSPRKRKWPSRPTT